MSSEPTPQEQLWRGDFGDAYIGRNVVTPEKLAALSRHWARVLRAVEADPPSTVLEVGANIGLNLRALRAVSTAELFAVEPNAQARAVLVADGVLPAENVMDGLTTRIPLADGAVDLAFTSGVLIHVHPDQLLASCREISRVSRRYVACVEYFSDVEQEVPYRGERGALFKRDFGGFYLDHVPELELVDYGFAWKRVTGLDNLTWQLFRKRG